MLHVRYGKRAAEWSPLEKPRGDLVRTRVRVAKHYTTKNRRQVPFIRELEPKGERWVFEGDAGSFLGVLPEALLESRASSSSRTSTGSTASHPN